MKSPNISRRALLKGSLAAWAASPTLTARASGPTGPKTKIFLFSKHLHWLDYPGMARVAATLGVDGLDLTVRPRGHVEPQRVKEDLPRAVTAMRATGLEIDMMTTAIQDPQDPLTHEVLATAADLGWGLALLIHHGFLAWIYA
ncbi:sugar phosphate isomerase/epimerase, partial [Planctomycetota bacterium]